MEGVMGGDRGLRYAELWRRFVANMVDMVVNVPVILLTWPGLLSRDAAIVGAVVSLVLGCGYSVVMHARWGQTLGKMVSFSF